jgi:hypothetical protein
MESRSPSVSFAAVAPDVDEDLDDEEVGLTRLGGQVGCGDHAAWAAGAWRMAS